MNRLKKEFTDNYSLNQNQLSKLPQTMLLICMLLVLGVFVWFFLPKSQTKVIAMDEVVRSSVKRRTLITTDSSRVIVSSDLETGLTDFEDSTSPLVNAVETKLVSSRNMIYYLQGGCRNAAIATENRNCKLWQFDKGSQSLTLVSENLLEVIQGINFDDKIISFSDTQDYSIGVNLNVYNPNEVLDENAVPRPFTLVRLNAETLAVVTKEIPAFSNEYKEYLKNK